MPERIEHHQRLLVHTQVSGGPRLDEFLERADAARKRYESVRLFRHAGLAGSHAIDDLVTCQVCMEMPLIRQPSRNHAMGCPACRKHCISQYAHEPLVRAAINQRHPATADLATEGCGGLHIDVALAGVGPAENRN